MRCGRMLTAIPLPPPRCCARAPGLVQLILYEHPSGDLSTRPAADMPVTDQLVYITIVSQLKDSVHPDLVSFTAGGANSDYGDFESFPLKITNARYVLTADVAAFYDYVDHDRLAYELIGATGEGDLVESLMSLLETWMGSLTGLPQGPSGSETLADIYISPVERALSRAGLEFARYSDDFRIAASNWSQAREAQLVLEGAMRDINLTISPKKLRTLRIDTYRNSIDALRRQREVPTEWDEAEVAAGDVGYQEETPVFEEISDEERAQAERIVDTYQDQFPDVASTRLLRWALSRLTVSRSPFLLDRMGPVLTRHPHLTPYVNAYLRTMLTWSELDDGTERSVVAKTVNWFGSSAYRYPWQVGWMLHAMAYVDGAYLSVAHVSSRVLMDGRAPWFARGQAALSLAVHGSLPSHGDYLSIYEMSPEATRPDLIAAVMIASPRWGARFLRGVTRSPMDVAVTKLDPSDRWSWLR